jgi:hypothetical protein
MDKSEALGYSDSTVTFDARRAAGKNGRRPDLIFALGPEMRISLDQNRVDELAHGFGLVVN